MLKNMARNILYDELEGLELLSLTLKEMDSLKGRYLAISDLLIDLGEINNRLAFENKHLTQKVANLEENIDDLLGDDKDKAEYMSVKIRRA